MKFKPLIFASISTMVGAFVIALIINPANAFDQIKKQRNLHAGLSLDDLTDNGIWGEVRVEAAPSKDGLEQVSIRIKTENMPSDVNSVFEVWLVDDNSGYNLSLGAFGPSRRGRMSLKFNETMVNFSIYDRVVITEEPLEDSNPLPGLPIMETNLPFSS